MADILKKMKIDVYYKVIIAVFSPILVISFFTPTYVLPNSKVQILSILSVFYGCLIWLFNNLMFSYETWLRYLLDRPLELEELIGTTSAQRVVKNAYILKNKMLISFFIHFLAFFIYIYLFIKIFIS